MALDELPGDPYLGLLGEAYNTQLVATIRLLANRRGPASLRLLVVDAQDRALRNAEAALSLEPPILSLACRKGCHHCCWETVGVLAPEAIHLADELRGRLTEVELSALRRRATRRGAQLRDVDRSARSQLRLPCALLKDRCCSAYGHRPLACRWALSPGLQACLDLMVHRTTPFLWMEEVRYQPIQEVWRGRAGRPP